MVDLTQTPDTHVSDGEKIFERSELRENDFGERSEFQENEHKPCNKTQHKQNIYNPDGFMFT